MSLSASISFNTGSPGSESRFNTLSALDPGALRLNVMLAMFTLCLPSRVPIQPTMPGRSLFSISRRYPSGRASIHWSLIRTMCGLVPKKVPLTSASFPSSPARTEINSAYSPGSACFVSVTFSPRLAAILGALTSFTSLPPASKRNPLRMLRVIGVVSSSPILPA